MELHELVTLHLGAYDRAVAASKGLAAMLRAFLTIVIISYALNIVALVTTVRHHRLRGVLLSFICLVVTSLAMRAYFKVRKEHRQIERVLDRLKQRRQVAATFKTTFNC